VARATDLGAAPLGVVLLGQPLVVWRSPAGIVAAADRCRHRGAALHRGEIADGLLICPYHGWHYESSGRCVAVPAHPGLALPASLRLITYPCRERHGLIWTVLGTPAVVEPPPFPAWDTPEARRLIPPSMNIEASAGRQLEGFIDVSHFAWVHAGSFGDRDRPLVPDYALERLPEGFRFTSISDVPNVPRGTPIEVPPGFRWSRTFEVTLPYLARLTVTFPHGGRLSLLNAVQPIAPDRCRVFTLVARDFGDDNGEETLAFNRRIFEEDQAIQAIQSPAWLPLAGESEFHVPSDRASITYRSMLSERGLHRA
jgi:phenylpropionate dioxygenase-like ring-hydroxylating dioxygenase large terminal subunit